MSELRDEVIREVVEELERADLLRAALFVRSMLGGAAAGVPEPKPQPQHHVEATSRNGWMWGWHCLTCGTLVDGEYKSLGAAELAGEEHASAAGPVVALPEPKEQQ